MTAFSHAVLVRKQKLSCVLIYNRQGQVTRRTYKLFQQVNRHSLRNPLSTDLSTG